MNRYERSEPCLKCGKYHDLDDGCTKHPFNRPTEGQALHDIEIERDTDYSKLTAMIIEKLKGRRES